MTAESPRFEGLDGKALASACGCSYDSLVEYLISNSATVAAAFDTFVSINRAVESSEGSGSSEPIGSQYLELFAACRSQAA